MTSSFSQYILFFLFFILPFIVLPFGISPFETPKVYVAEIGVIILILWYVSQHSLRSFLKRNYLPFFVLGVLAVIDRILMPTPTALFGNAFRMQGLFLFLLLLLFSLCSSKIQFRYPSMKVATFLLVIQLVAAVFIQTKMDFRAIGTLGEANSLAAFAVVMLSLLFFPHDKEAGKDKGEKGNKGNRGIIMWVGGIIGIALILFSGSRSGLIAFILLGLFYLLQKYSLKIAVICCLVLLTLSLSLPFLQQQQLFENRVTIWQTAITAGMMKPFFGWGAGNTEHALQEGSEHLSNAVRFEYIDHTHNIFLEMFVTTGLIGLGVFLFLVILSFKTLYDRKRKRDIVLLLGLFCMLSFNPLSVALLLQFWFVLGRGLTGQIME